MTNSVSQITLNLQQPNSGVVCYAVQDDTLSHVIAATLVDGSIPYTPSSGVMGAVRYRKPDGTAGFYDTLENGETAVGFIGNTATIRCAAQMLTVAGDVAVQLQLYDAEGARLSTLKFTLVVAVDVVSDAEIESTDYFNILSQQIAAVLNAAESLTGMTASAETLPAGSDASVEVTGGSDGVPYNLNFGLPRGPVGPAPTIQSQTVQYQTSASGTTIPTGAWNTTPPSPVTPGTFLWTWTHVVTDSGNIDTYTVSYNGMSFANLQEVTFTVPMRTESPDGGTTPAPDYLDIAFTTPSGYSYITLSELVLNGAAVPYIVNVLNSSGVRLFPTGDLKFSSTSIPAAAIVTAHVLYGIQISQPVTPDLSGYATKAELTAATEDIPEIESDVSDLKSYLSAYNSFDLLRQFPKPTKSTSNLTVTWNGEVATVNGEATSAAEANCNFYNTTSAMPEGFSAGQKLFIRVVTSSPYLRLAIIPYISGTAQTAQYFTADGEYTIPSGTTGIVLRLSIVQNVSFVNATFSAHILTAPSNAEIAENRRAIDVNRKNLLDYNSVPLVVGDPSLNIPNKNGVSYTWGEKSTCVTAGTSTNISFCTLYEDMAKLPDGLNPGDTVWFDCASTNPLVRGVVSFFDSNSTKVGETFATSPTAITVPASAVGARIRITMNSGVNAAGTIRIRLLRAKSNVDLQSDVDAIQARVGTTVMTPMLTIIDDDGSSGFYTDLYALSQSKKVPIACALPYSSIDTANHLTLAQVKEMYGNGIEILSHTYSHWTDFTGKTEADFEAEYRKAKHAFNLIGIPCELLVYSGSSGNLAAAKEAASRVYDGAIASGNQNTNYCGGNKYFIERYGVTGDGSDGRLNGESLASLTAAIDTLAANGGWMIWMTHTSASYWSETMLGNIGDAIDYALAKGIPIVTAEYGFKTYFGA